MGRITAKGHLNMANRFFKAAQEQTKPKYKTAMLKSASYHFGLAKKIARKNR